MLVNSFDAAATLATVTCPRCRNVGLIESDHARHQATPARNRHLSQFHSDPSVYCRCPACALEAEWPGCQVVGTQPPSTPPTDVATQEPQAVEAGWWGTTGRISRVTFIGRAVACTVVGIGWLWGAREMGLPLWIALVGVAMLKAVYVMQCIKRGHDFGVGSWSGVLAATPLLDMLWLLPLAFIPGSPLANRHGPRPASQVKPWEAVASTDNRERDRARLVALMR